MADDTAGDEEFITARIAGKEHRFKVTTHRVGGGQFRLPVTTTRVGGGQFRLPVTTTRVGGGQLEVEKLQRRQEQRQRYTDLLNDHSPKVIRLVSELEDDPYEPIDLDDDA